MKKIKWIDILKWVIVIGLIAVIMPRFKWFYTQNNIGNITDIPEQEITEDNQEDPYMPYMATVSKISYDSQGNPSRILVTDLNETGKEYIIENSDEFITDKKMYSYKESEFMVQVIPLDDERALIYPYIPYYFTTEELSGLYDNVQLVYPFQSMIHNNVLELFGWDDENADGFLMYSQNAYDGSTILVSKNHILDDADKQKVIEMATQGLNDEGKAQEYVCLDYSNDDTSVFMIVEPSLFNQVIESFEFYIDGFNRNNEAMYFSFKDLIG